MELIHNIIPPNFFFFLPKGIKFVNKESKEFLVIENLTCPEGHSLMADTVKIHGEPSIKLIFETADREGAVFIDSYWGSHSKLFSFIPQSTDPVDIKCPVCGKSMLIDMKCEHEGCGFDKAVMLKLPGNANKIYVCAKLGCPGHKIDINEIPDNISEIISEINYFGTQEDNYFEGI